ncbi:hypothetical protein [Streptomyces sp. NPDC001020]
MTEVRTWSPRRGDLAFDVGRQLPGVVIALPEDTGTAMYELSPEGGGEGWMALRRRIKPAQSATAAILYVRPQPQEPPQDAEKEGRAFAETWGLLLLETIVDSSSHPEPLVRGCWRQVRQLVLEELACTVIMRGPEDLSPDTVPELRRHELQWLKNRGVRVCFTAGPLAQGGEAR